MLFFNIIFLSAKKFFLQEPSVSADLGRRQPGGPVSLSLNSRSPIPASVSGSLVT